MKNSIIVGIASILLLTSCRKSSIEDNNNGTANVISASSVPQAVLASFNAEFSGATAVEWQRNSSSTITSQFNHSSQRHEAQYDDSGHRSSHSILCIDGPVPEVVLNAFRARFPTDNVYEWKLRNDGTWRAHMLRNGVKFEATYSAAGALIKFEQSR